jgi:hypothetical protein
MAPLYVLRALNLGGLVVLLFEATRRLPWRPLVRVTAAVAVMLLSPAVYQGMTLGNASFLVAALIVLSLVVWPPSPLLAGGLLGASLALKPLGPAAWVVLAFHRPREGGYKHRWAAAAAVIVMVVSLVLVPGWSVFLERAGRAEVLASTVSPHRFLALADAAWLSPWLTLAVLALLGGLARRRVHSPDGVLVLASAGCIAAAPLVWNHTLLLTLPLQAMAVHAAVCLRRREPGRRSDRELALVCLASLALHLAEGATGITNLSAALQAVAVVPPVAAPPLLLAYVWRRGPTQTP